MKFINLKVLLLAALLSPIALAAQVCVVAPGSTDSPECGYDENGPLFDTLKVFGSGNLDLTRFTDLRGVKIKFESNVNAEFSPTVLINSSTEFISPNNQGHLAIDGESGKLTFNGNGNNFNIQDVNTEMSLCDDICTLLNRTTNVVMPVTLLSWTTQVDGVHVALAWETAAEEDNSHFVISRSTDGRNFTVIATVSGRGTTESISSYRYRDAEAVAGPNYYRLEQFDFDGTSTELGVQFVTFQGELAAIKLSPNPVASGQLVQLGRRMTADVDVDIFAPNGSHVGTYRAQGGSFRVPKLTAGVYTLRIYDQVARLVVAR